MEAFHQDQSSLFQALSAHFKSAIAAQILPKLATDIDVNQKLIPAQAARAALLAYNRQDFVQAEAWLRKVDVDSDQARELKEKVGAKAELQRGLEALEA